MTTSTLPSASPCNHLVLLRRREEPAEELDPDRVGRVPVGERLGVLAGQQRRGRQHRRLRPVLHRLEDGAHRHLGLAEADVAADQTVHRPRLFHVRLDVVDRLELVLGLDEAERALHLGLPRCVGAEGVALHGQPAPVELHQLVRHLAGRGARLGPGALPVGPAHLRERRGLAPAVRRDGLDLVDRQVQPVAAAVLQDQVVAGGARPSSARSPPRSGPRRAGGGPRSCPPRGRRRSRRWPGPGAGPAGAGPGGR